MDDDLPNEYDVIVVGTGLVESVVAAASARIGKKVLHLDKNSYYGKLWSTFNLESFEQWLTSLNSTCQTKNCATFDQHGNFDTCEGEPSLSSVQWQWFVSRDKDNLLEEKTVSDGSDHCNEASLQINKKLKLSQKFNIDLSPKIIFSKGPMVELLIRSGVSRYTEFVNVHNVLLYLNSVIEAVPYSKSDIFSTRTVSVVEKRILMKLLQEIQSFSEEKENECYDNISFCEFLSRFQIPENLQKYIIYSIARISKESPCIEGIKSAKLFLNSLGVYGNSPFLWPLYGSSELVQAFCRLCAVYGGIYCLNRGVDEVLVENGKCLGVMSKGKKLLAEHVVMSSSETPSKFFIDPLVTKSITRGILITDKTLYSSGKKGASMLQFPMENSSLPPVTVIELGIGCLAAPDDLYVVHLIKEGSDNEYKDFDKLVQELFQDKTLPKDTSEINEENNKPSVLFKFYFNVSQIESECSGIKPKNFYTCQGPVNFEIDFFSALKEAENIFKHMYANEEFLPPPPETPSEE